MTIVWFVGGTVLTLVGLVCVVGAVLPRDHVATGSALVGGAPAEVWRVIRDVERVPTWRKSVTAVEGVEAGGPDGGASAWVERSGKDGLRMMVGRCEVERMIETRIDDKGLPFGGTWTIELAPEGEGTRVRVTERGFVRTPPFRFIAKFFIGHSSNLRRYLTDLASRNGGAAVIEQ